MNKEIKKEYDKNQTKITLRLTPQEEVLLNKLKEEEDCTNVSVIIKEKVFGERDKRNAKYDRCLASGEKNDIENILKVSFKNLSDKFNYINYRFNYELGNLEKEIKKSGLNEKLARRYISIMGDWKQYVQNRTEEVLLDCEKILEAINIKVERARIEGVKYAPDYVLEKAAKNWDDTSSPEAIEVARRIIDEFNRKQEAILEQRRREASKKEKKNKDE